MTTVPEETFRYPELPADLGDQILSYSSYREAPLLERVSRAFYKPLNNPSHTPKRQKKSTDVKGVFKNQWALTKFYKVIVVTGRFHEDFLIQ